MPEVFEARSEDIPRILARKSAIPTQIDSLRPRRKKRWVVEEEKPRGNSQKNNQRKYGSNASGCRLESRGPTNPAVKSRTSGKWRTNGSEKEEAMRKNATPRCLALASLRLAYMSHSP